MVCSDINERYDIREAPFASVFEVFCISSNLVVSGFGYRMSLIFESSQLSEFSTDLQDSGLKVYFISLGTALCSHESFYFRYFSIFNQTSKNFLRHPPVHLLKATSSCFSLVYLLFKIL